MQDRGSFSLSFSGKQCLVTGGCGFIGSNLVRALIELDAKVMVLDNLSSGKLEHLPSSDKVSFIHADISSFSDWAGVLHATDYVFHLAAQVGNVKSIELTESDAMTNIVGSVRLFTACRRTKIRKLVYASSSAIFGEAETIPISEGHRQAPASFYALSKQTAEQYAVLANGLWGIPAVCVRFFNAYGLPMEQSEYSGVINIFMDRLLHSLPLTIYGDGSQIRDFVYVNDICQAILLAAEHGLPGTAYNIGTGTASSIRHLAEALIGVSGLPAEIRNAPERQGEVRRSVADIGKARRDLQYAPEYSLEEGLEAIWRRKRRAMR
jgi:UDP-glucose 4-epimerase